MNLPAVQEMQVRALGWEDPLEKEMTTDSNILAWIIPQTEESGRQPTPVFLPGESQGRGSLVGCCLWGRTELDTTEAT